MKLSKKLNTEYSFGGTRLWDFLVVDDNGDETLVGKSSEIVSLKWKGDQPLLASLMPIYKNCSANEMKDLFYGLF